MNGDFTKVKYAAGLSEAGSRILQNLEHTSRQILGTQEVRKLMRCDTHAGRIRRGVPIFVTWSPDEKHSVLMLRLSRSRASDPVNEFDALSQKYGANLR